MTEAALMAAVPGQSLTDYPKNYPWERPPELVDFNDAVKYHMDRVSQENVIDNILDALEFGVPAKVLSDSMMSGAVASGIHSIDVSLIAEPIIRSFIMKSADMAGVEYKETFKGDVMSTEERAAMLMGAVQATPKDKRDEGFKVLKEAAESVKEEPEEEMTEEKSKGLMARE